MDQGIIASLPLGLVVLAALVLLALGVGLGGLAAGTRARRRATRATRAERERIAELLNALPQASLIADAEAHILIRNPKAAQLLKSFDGDGQLPLTVDAAIGRVVHSRMAEALEIASPGVAARRLQVSVTPLRLGDPTPEALVVFTDPTAGSNRADVYQRLISTLAHELRTPLTAIMGHVEILNSCRLDEEALWRRSLGFVAGEAERLARLVEDMLNLSRLDRMPLHLQAVNLREVAEDALAELFGAGEQSRATPILQVPPELPRVLADPDRIHQVFINLLDNAIKYASGSVVTVRLILEDELVRVEVSDSGPGIAAEDLPHIFEPFHRGERTPFGARGAGLGLTIVRAILDQHHAPINVRSDLGQGATFSFALPIARSA